MPSYAILANPGHNRIYFEAAKVLALSELSIVLGASRIPYADCRGEELGGVYYLCFSTESPIVDTDWNIFRRLSFLYAMFEKIPQEGEVLLRPVLLPNTQYLDEGISRILRYSGKTNELFTRMLLSIGAAAAGGGERLRLLDPIAGKGTTLFEGLVAGYDSYGIEIGEKAANEAFLYLKKYLETEKCKHSGAIERVSGANKSFTAKRYAVTLAKTKEDYKADNTRHWELVAGDSRYADAYFKKNFFDLLVGDLPYGVQHGNVTDPKQAGLTRSPKELLTACLPAWRRVLRPGGALVLSWNSFVFSKEEFAALLTEHGFAVRQGEEYSLAHRVDQAIRRDVIVAVRR